MTFDQLIKMAVNALLQQEVVPLSAAGLMQAREHVVRWNIPADHFVFPVELTPVLFAEDWFVHAIDPAPPQDPQVKEGLIGSFYGMKIIVDRQYRLAPDEVAVLSERGAEAGHLAERCVFKFKFTQ